MLQTRADLLPHCATKLVDESSGGEVRPPVPPPPKVAVAKLATMTDMLPPIWRKDSARNFLHPIQRLNGFVSWELIANQQIRNKQVDWEHRAAIITPNIILSYNFVDDRFWLTSDLKDFGAATNPCKLGARAVRITTRDACKKLFTFRLSAPGPGSNQQYSPS
jgi:hypothetical protein